MPPNGKSGVLGDIDPSEGREEGDRALALELLPSRLPPSGAHEAADEGSIKPATTRIATQNKSRNSVSMLMHFVLPAAAVCIIFGHRLEWAALAKIIARVDSSHRMPKYSLCGRVRRTFEEDWMGILVLILHGNFVDNR